MGKREDVLQRILDFATRNEEIEMVVLEGSLAKERYVDALSDLDLNFWIKGEQDFSAGDWLAEIGEVLVAVPLDFPVREGMRSLIVIFEGGVKVDFSFWPLSFLETPFPYYEAYRVLLDKIDYANNLDEFLLPKSASKLTQARFLEIIDQFYLDAHYLAKFTRRGERFFVANLEAEVRENYFLPLFEEIVWLSGKTPMFLGRHLAEMLPVEWKGRMEQLLDGLELPEQLELFQALTDEIADKRGFQVQFERIQKLKQLILVIYQNR
ncbi:aminoglycoside 6-adenylyltransferase [Listeria valentina]|uniref:aminoglycoside 6-adenylyltransferase n=1 Tax=Listeria valentina TaxID=2705293 RepID=UPI001431819B|nr:aminoglycoside 6-adenylyltransferase [Listeria valentina]